MQTNRILGVGLILLVIAAIAVWQFGGGASQPSLGPTPLASSASGSAALAEASIEQAGNAVDAATPVASGSVDGRVAVAANAPLDDSKPALVGRIVGPDGRAIAGAKVFAAPGMSFANASGQLDFDTFDVADFDEIEGGDMTQMMSTLRQQLAERVEVATDPEGRFRIHPRGTSRGVGLRVLARGHVILDRRVSRPGEQDVDVGTLSLQLGAVVTGRVLDPAGNAIVGARVSRIQEAEARMMGGLDIDMPEMGEVEAMRGGEVGTTDAAGKFELLHLAAGDFSLRARHPDHPTAKRTELTVAVGAELRDVLITMARGGEIRGRVTSLPEDAKGLRVVAAKKPRADADPSGMMSMFGDITELMAEAGMSVSERTTEIAADGQFVLRGLARDTYRVWVERTGAGIAGNAMCSPRVESQPDTASVELRFESGVSVTFTVVDAATGVAIERLWVKDVLRGGGGMTEMMAMGGRPGRLANYPAGAVTVANLRAKPKQKLQLTLDAVGYKQLEREGLELPKTGTLDLGTLRMEPTPVVTVTVVNDADGQALAGASVRLEAEGSRGGSNPFAQFGRMGGGGGPDQGKTDRAGQCVLNRFTAASGQFEVDAKGFAPFVSEVIAFDNDGPIAFTARVHVGGNVEVSVRDLGDNPVKDAVVEHRTPTGDIAQTKSDAQGLARFERVAPGAHGFRLGKDAGPMGMMLAQMRDRAESGAEVPWQTVEVVDRANATLRLTKAATAALHGVVRENGLPLVGARVAFTEGVGDVEGERDMAERMMGDMLGGLAGGGGGGRNGKTDERGAYALKELPDGAHRLRITHKGRAMPTLFPVVLQNGDNTFDVELDMTTVRGTVRDPQGNPVDGARIRVRRPRAEGSPANEIADTVEGMMPGMGLGNTGSTIKTDATGAFELRGVDPDVELSVEATAKGFSPASAKVTAVRGTTSSVVNLQVGAAGKIKVTTTSEAPFAAVTARYIGEGGPVPPVMQMLRKGKGTLDGLRPGLWEIEVQGMRPRDGESAPKRTVEVVAGQTAEIEL